MESAKEKISNLASAAKEKVEICRAKAEEKVYDQSLVYKHIYYRCYTYTYKLLMCVSCDYVFS